MRNQPAINCKEIDKKIYLRNRLVQKIIFYKKRQQNCESFCGRQFLKIKIKIT